MVKIKRGRDAGTGRFITTEEAERRKKEAYIDTIEVKPRTAKPKPTKPAKPRRAK